MPGEFFLLGFLFFLEPGPVGDEVVEAKMSLRFI